MSRRHAVSLFAMSLVALACQPKPSAHPADASCEDFELDVKKSWNDETRIALRAEVMQWQGEAELEVAKQVSSEVETTLDTFASDWVRLRKASCLDHFKREVISAEQYQARAACYDEVLLRQRSLVEAAIAGEAQSLEAFAALAEAIGACNEA